MSFRLTPPGAGTKTSTVAKLMSACDSKRTSIGLVAAELNLHALKKFCTIGSALIRTGAHPSELSRLVSGDTPSAFKKLKRSDRGAPTVTPVMYYNRCTTLPYRSCTIALTIHFPVRTLWEAFCLKRCPLSLYLREATRRL